MKRKSAEKQDASDSEPVSEEDESSGLQVSAPWSYGFPNNPPPSPGAITSISAENFSSDNSQLFNLQFSPRDSLHVDTLRGRTLGQSSSAEAIDFLGIGNWNLDENLPSRFPTSLSISPPLSRDPTTLDLSRLLRCVQDFSDARLRSPYKDRKQTPDLEAFWHNFYNCIYLYKLDNIERAEPLLNQLCSVSSEVLHSLPIDSVSRLLAAFAPVNFRRHPEVRTILLSHFIKMTEEAFGHDNKLTVICKELQKDEDSRYSTETALRCILDSMHLARSPSQFATEREIIALLRRDKAFDDATQMAESLYQSSQTGAKPKLDEIRSAAMELAHIYMDIGRFDDARGLCMIRVGKAVARDGLIGHEYHDSGVLYALEDLAKIDEESGALKESTVWLGEAAHLARAIKGPSIALTHILDKLVRALRLCGRDGDAEATIRLYAS